MPGIHTESKWFSYANCHVITPQGQREKTWTRFPYIDEWGGSTGIDEDEAQMRTCGRGIRGSPGILRSRAPLCWRPATLTTHVRRLTPLRPHHASIRHGAVE